MIIVRHPATILIASY